MKDFVVKSVFKTLQGEGYWAGRSAVFVRFAGCNLWSGVESDRTTAICRFCDTDFVGDDVRKISGDDLVREIVAAWGNGRDHRFVVLTGGEPTLQIDWSFVATLHRFDFYVAIETNGTREVCPLVDWITVSPKAGTEIVQRKGDELKLVFPQEDTDPTSFVGLDFANFFLQPKHDVSVDANTAATIRYCQESPKWRLSVQTHKLLGLA